MKLFYPLTISMVALLVSGEAAWSPPVTLYSDQTVSAPVVGVDSGGNALFIVSANNGSYFEETGQFKKGVVSNLNDYQQIAGSSFQANQNIAVSGDGSALLAWVETDALSSNFLRAALFLNNSWQPPTSLSSTSTTLVDSSTNPGLNISASKEALAVWISLGTVGGMTQVEWNLYKNGAWTNPGTYIIQNSNFLNDLKLSGNSTGQAFAIWVDETPSVLQGALFNGTSWDLNPSIATDVLVGCLPPIDVAMNENGEALLVWANSSGGVSALTYKGGIYSAEDFPAPNSTSTVTGISAAFTDDGQGVAVWTSVDITGTIYMVSGNRYIEGVWSDPILLDAVMNGSGNTLTPNVKMDRYGNALAVWNKADGLGNSGIYYAISNRSSNATSGSNVWTDLASPISIDPTSISPNLSMNAEGLATVVWSISDSGPETSQASYLASPLFTPQPPQNFTGTQSKNKLPWQIEFVNILNWQASPSQDVVSYTLFLNDTELATIRATSPLTYHDRDRKKDVGSTYQLVTTSKSGLQSPPITLFVP